MNAQEKHQLVRRVMSRIEENCPDHETIQEAAALLKANTPLPERAVQTDGDHIELAEELVEAFNQELYRRKKAKNGDRELMEINEILDGDDFRMLMDKSPRDIEFRDLEHITRGPNPENALVLWERIKAAARRDVESGWQAARSLTVESGPAWVRAVFLAVRERLERDWPPLHPGEAMILDELAQLELLRQRLLSVHYRSLGDPVKSEAASRSLDRVGRSYHNAVRALLTIREKASPRKVQRPSVVNMTFSRPANGEPKGERATINNNYQQKTWEVNDRVPESSTADGLIE
ncbi:MAG: hypothetical protein EXS09_11180 [Gemmataceae bacterium]|nr:hypothetical protein [Gemmataceae bacterium]